MKVFVYGTLKKNRSNSYLLKGSEFVEEAETIDRFCMRDLVGFPAVTQEKPVSTIKGEVYKIDEDTLKRLDGLEGYPHLYDRITVQVKLASGDIEEAIMYIASKATVERIQDTNIIGDGIWENQRVRHF